jgi:FixJ family two-component response regulator
MTTSTARVVALVDDDAALCTAIANLLRSAGIDIAIFSTAEQFLKSVQRERISCLVLDLGLPGMGGEELLRQVRASGWSVPIVCITGQPDRRDELCGEVLRAGARTILYKPFDAEELLQILQSEDVPRSEGLDSDQTRTESCSGPRRG